MRPRPGSRDLVLPDLQARAFLDHAAISPPPLPVRRAAAEAIELVARLGRASLPVLAARRDRLRARFGELVGVGPREVGLVANTTTGIVDVAMSLDWRRGDRVAVYEGEFPANVLPWLQAAETFGIEVVRLPLAGFGDGSGLGLARLEDELRRGLRLVAVSAVQFATGLRMPVEAMARLCRPHGTALFVDAIQAVGVVPLDLSGVDFASCGSHKWLMGLEGAACLVVAPHRMDDLRPRVTGWLSRERALDFLFEGPGHLAYDRPLKRDASAFEVGTLNAVGFAALEAAVDLVHELGVERVFAHVTELVEALEEGLLARGFRSLRRPLAPSGILSVDPPAGRAAVDLARALGERGVACSMPDGHLRFSPSWPTRREDVDIVLETLDELLA